MRHLTKSHTVKRETLGRTSEEGLCFYIYIDCTLDTPPSKFLLIQKIYSRLQHMTFKIKLTKLPSLSPLILLTCPCKNQSATKIRRLCFNLHVALIGQTQDRLAATMAGFITATTTTGSDTRLLAVRSRLLWMGLWRQWLVEV